MSLIPLVIEERSREGDLSGGYRKDVSGVRPSANSSSATISAIHGAAGGFMKDNSRPRGRCAGAAFIESIVLLVALTVTLIGVFALYSMTWNRFACTNIFAVDIGNASGYPENLNLFNPPGKDLYWVDDPSSQGCWHVDTSPGVLKKLF